jgi:glycosyltransferase involved in cell wall biosynthesis
LQKLAIISTHPIQYNAPFFKLLSQRGNILVKVFYTWSQSQEGIKYDPGFGKKIEWDIPLLDGYECCFVANISKLPGSHHYKGIDNPTLVNEINAWGANAVLVYGWSFKSHFKAMRFFKGKLPVLFRGDSTLLDEQLGLKKIVRKFFLKYVYSYIDYAMYAGTANKAYFLAHGLKEYELAFMPHAIDNNRFAKNDEVLSKASELRNKFNIPKDNIVFLFAGKLEHKKQPDFLAKVFASLKTNDASLVIVGNGIMEIEFKKEYANVENIHFLDFQNQQIMPALYAACDVFVLPSKGPYETWGLAINEAMAAGKPVIVSNACGAAYDLVEQGTTGFVFNKHGEHELKKYIQFFITNKDEIHKMESRILEKIKEYSHENDCIALEKIILNIIPKI